MKKEELSEIMRVMEDLEGGIDLAEKHIGAIENLLAPVLPVERLHPGGEKEESQASSPLGRRIESCARRLYLLNQELNQLREDVRL